MNGRAIPICCFNLLFHVVDNTFNTEEGEGKLVENYFRLTFNAAIDIK